MFKWILSIIAFCLAGDAFAQADTTWFDTHWDVCTKDSARYYRTPPVDSNGLFYANDYFLDGRLQMSGSYANKNCSIREGYFIHYDSAGHITYEGVHHKGNREGVWKFYLHSTHQLSRTSTYHTDMLNGPSITYDTVSGQKLMEGDFCNGARCGAWRLYYPGTTILHEEIMLSSNKPDGYLKTYYENGRLRREDVYVTGQFVSGKCYAPDGSKIKKHIPYRQHAQFDGNLWAYVDKHLKYPAAAAKDSIGGVVVVECVIEKDGRVSNVKVVRGIGGGCSEEAMRLVSTMPRWKPCMMEGQPEQSTIRIDIPFASPGKRLAFSYFDEYDF